MATPDRPTRDADRTRQALVDAALTRFARDGYTGTRVRHIAGDAGVDAALINRYFGSKAGLFDACLQRSGEIVVELGQGVADLHDVRDRVLHNMSRARLKQGVPDALLLLLRPTRDPEAERARVAVLRGFGENLASLAGWPTDGSSTDDRLLRAELLIAISFGVTALRVSGLEPLASTGTAGLRHYLDRIFARLLEPSTDSPPER